MRDDTPQKPPPSEPDPWKGGNVPDIPKAPPPPPPPPKE